MFFCFSTAFSLLFFYTKKGDAMKIYLDVIFLINFVFDFLLLMSVSIILKRNIKVSRIILGALLGALSIFLLFIRLNNLTLFLFKMLISIIMVLITFKYKSFKYTLINLSYLYLSSIILGGFLYFLNIQFSYKNEGIIFFHNGFSINLIVLIITSPLILYIYIKSNKKLKLSVSNYHQVDIIFNDGKKLKLNGYLDTGNCLYDQYKHRPIVLVHSSKIKYSYDNVIYVPFKTLNNNGLIKCIKISKLIIDNRKTYKNILLGFSTDSFKIDGVDIILHRDLMEEYND